MFNVIKIEMKVEQPRNNNTRRQNSRFHFEKLFFFYVRNLTLQIVQLSEWLYYLWPHKKGKKKERGNVC